jgi:hypothetical protein
MSDPIKTLCTVLLDIAKTSPSANINDVMAQVKSALDRNAKLTNALQTDTRMLQINLGQSKQRSCYAMIIVDLDKVLDQSTIAGVEGEQIHSSVTRKP